MPISRTALIVDQQQTRNWPEISFGFNWITACMGLSVSSARHCRSALVEGPAWPRLGGMRDDRRGARHRGALVIAPQTCMRSTRLGPNHDAAVRIGGEAPGRRAHSRRRLCGPCMMSDHRHLGSSSVSRPSNLGGRRNWSFDFSFWAAAHAAGRRTTPSGGCLVVTSRHNAMSNFLANATIMVLRVLPRASAVRSRYHRASALSSWKSRKRQASCTMPWRTRALPALAKPFSRRRRPLSSGEPVRPA